MKKIERTSEGLRNALFDEIDALRAGKSNPAKARALSQSISVILKSVEVDIEYQKYVAQLGNKQIDDNTIGMLKLGS